MICNNEALKLEKPKGSMLPKKVKVENPYPIKDMHIWMYISTP